MMRDFAELENFSGQQMVKLPWTCSQESLLMFREFVYFNRMLVAKIDVIIELLKLGDCLQLDALKRAAWERIFVMLNSSGLPQNDWDNLSQLRNIDIVATLLRDM